MSTNTPQPGTNWYSRYEGFLRNKNSKKPKGLGGNFAQNYIPIKKNPPRQPDAAAAQARKSDADQFREAMKRKLSNNMRPGPVNKGRPS